MSSPAKWWSVPVFAAVASLGLTQPLAENTIQLDGETLHFSIRAFPAGANLIDPAAPLAPVSALDTAKLLNRYLTSGEIEDAALLSNAPRRRFEVLRDYQNAVGDDGFKQVFAEYFYPDNRVVAEVTMGSHSLLVWHLRAGNRYAGQFYAQVDGKVFVDDIPSPTRSALRHILEAIRAGRLPLLVP